MQGDQIMTIDAIGASNLPATAQISPNPAVQGLGAVSDGDNDASAGQVSGGHHHHGGGKAFMNSVLQALSQSGLSSTDSSPANGDVTQAMHAFMHSLFTAMHSMSSSQSSGAVNSDANNGASSAAGGVPSGYSSPSTNLQSL